YIYIYIYIYIFHYMPVCCYLSDGSDVNQTPLLWVNESQPATMSCNHTKDINHNQMYWYQQLPGQNMKQIVFTTAYSHQYEQGFNKEKFPAEKKDAQTGSLTVNNSQPEDSGVYFCAVSKHSDAADKQSCTKTQMLLL
uniref:Ig-like domain-containing protein n=1 Tax=Cyprinodon variegatus TaxID=28743 RepID=A0A3Q2D5L7_CYPVA